MEQGPSAGDDGAGIIPGMFGTLWNQSTVWSPVTTSLLNKKPRILKYGGVKRLKPTSDGVKKQATFNVKTFLKL